MDTTRSYRWSLLLALPFAAWACSGQADREAADAVASVAEVAAVNLDAPAARTEGTLEGQVVDVSCHVAQGLRGDTHRQCAETCANDLGIPLNILADDGTLYHLVDDDMPGHDQNPTVVQFAEQRVRVTGTIVEKAGNHGIIVKDVALVEGTANPAALAASSDPELGRTFNTVAAANPCAGAINPCASGKANPCAANPCAAGQANPCAAKNPCVTS